MRVVGSMRLGAMWLVNFQRQWFLCHVARVCKRVFPLPYIGIDRSLKHIFSRLPVLRLCVTMRKLSGNCHRMSCGRVGGNTTRYQTHPELMTVVVDSWAARDGLKGDAIDWSELTR